MREIIKDSKNVVTKVHDCAYEVKHGRQEIKFINIPTQFITNAPSLAIELEKLIDKKVKIKEITSKEAPIYPNQLNATISMGMELQKKIDKTNQCILGSIDLENGLAVLKALDEAKKNAEQCHEPEWDNQYGYAVDDNTGAYLDPKMVKKARAE